MASRFTADQRMRATVDRFCACTDYMTRNDAVPQIVIGEGHSGRIRSEPAPVLWVVDELPIDFVIATLRASLEHLEAVQRGTGKIV